MSVPPPPDPDREPPTPPPASAGGSQPGTSGGSAAGTGSGQGSSTSGGSGASGAASGASSGSASDRGGGATGGGGDGGGAGRGSRRTQRSAAGQEASGGEKDEAPAAEEVTPPTPFTQQLGRVTIVVIAALFGVFAVANSQRVDFSWVFGETTVRTAADGEGTVGGVPLIVLLLGAFVIGAVIAILTELYVSRSRRARKAAQQRDRDA